MRRLFQSHFRSGNSDTEPVVAGSSTSNSYCSEDEDTESKREVSQLPSSSSSSTHTNHPPFHNPHSDSILNFTFNRKPSSPPPPPFLQQQQQQQQQKSSLSPPQSPKTKLKTDINSVKTVNEDSNSSSYYQMNPQRSTDGSSSTTFNNNHTSNNTSNSSTQFSSTSSSKDDPLNLQNDFRKMSRADSLFLFSKPFDMNDVLDPTTYQAKGPSIAHPKTAHFNDSNHHHHYHHRNQSEDLELATYPSKVQIKVPSLNTSSSTSSPSDNANNNDSSTNKTKGKLSSALSKLKSSFEIINKPQIIRDENNNKKKIYVTRSQDELPEQQKTALANANAPLVRDLRSRHMQMIAFGGAIGTGIFINSGASLVTGGPASLIIGFSLTGIMLLFTIQALCELAVRFPVAGSFSTFATRFIEPAWGFALGWNYALQWLIVFPLEIVAAAMTIRFWSNNGENAAASVNPAAWVVLFFFVISAINLFGVKIFGEIEFVFSVLKVIAMLGFIILGIILTCGGGPHGGYIGGRYWHDPGAFSHGFKGVISVLVNASFSYLGTELSGLAAAEAKNPRRSVPSAVKKVCWRIVLFYIVSLTIVGCLVPYTDTRLLNASSNVDISTSPFVIAIKNAGIDALPSLFNAVILIAVMSVGNSSVYAASRTLCALATMGLAPRQLGYIDRAGRPIIALYLTFAFGLLAFIGASGRETQVFNWLLSLSGLANLFTWGSICLCHIRFRQALKFQKRTTAELAFAAPLGIWGSIIGLLLNVVILVLIIWIALYPINSSTGSKANPENFFQEYLAVPIFLLFYIPWKIWKKSKIVKISEMDLDTGTREFDLELLQFEIAEEKERLKEKGWIFYIYNVWC